MMPNTVDILQALAPLLAAVAIFLGVSRRRVIAALVEADATGPPSSVVLPDSVPNRFWTPKLIKAGVIGATGDGRYWLDRSQWLRYRAVRRRRGITIFLCLSLTLALLYWFGVTR